MMNSVRLVWDKDRAGYVEPQQRKTRNLDQFVKGPIPLAWLETAASLPGKALHVGLAIWFIRGMTRTDTVKLKRSTLARFGVSRKAYYAALDSLEAAGLITVERKPGRAAKIWLRTGGLPDHIVPTVR